MKKHKVKSVEQGSIAQALEIAPGDYLLCINQKQIEDIFDYRYMIQEETLTLLVQKKDGIEWELEFDKNMEDDLGIEFEEGLMDSYRSCRNKCVFCFIDQMPPGMRETLYFKDDDSRLSFLQGNYITLTNLTEKDLERIILYKLAPINISVHTTNPLLRCRMLHNRFAGDALGKLKKLYDAGIEMNSQIVLCKGYNDKEELDKSIKDLAEYIPYMKSLSIVPVGLSKYRKNLEPLEKFLKEEAVQVLNQIHGWQDIFLRKYGTRFVYASDEWYLTAGYPIPAEAYYEGYGQIENGVGMVRSLTDEVNDYLAELQGDERNIQVSAATGILAAPIIENLAAGIQKKFPNMKINVYPIRNDFFGEDITVAGLLTGQDIIKQLKGEKLGDYLVLPDVLLKSGEEVLLDDLTVADLARELEVSIHIAASDGKSFVDSILNID